MSKNTKQKSVFFPIACVMSGSQFAEVFPPKKGFDPYGSYLDVKETATGRFHLERIKGSHFLMTPDGELCFDRGIP